MLLLAAKAVPSLYCIWLSAPPGFALGETAQVGTPLAAVKTNPSVTPLVDSLVNAEPP